MDPIVESSEAVITKTLDGIVMSWNKGAERLFGYSAKEAIGRNIYLLIPADRQNEEAQILERLRTGEDIEQFETIRQHKDGRRVQVSLNISPIRDETGRIVGASATAHDITER
jgi:PAS domain S-box-containing protein